MRLRTPSLSIFAALSCAALMAVAAADEGPLGIRQSRAAPPQQARPIVLIGLDAADWLAIDPLIRAGQLPTFEKLKSSGRTGVMLSTPPLVSPMLWTTIATGVQPENHGILDFMVDRPDGTPAPVGSSQRLAPAIWNLFSHYGRRVAIVGWWATWPAEEVRGTIVSDALAPQLARQNIQTTAGLVSPAAAWARVSTSIVKVSALTRADLSRYVALTADEYATTLRTSAQRDGRMYEDPLAHLAAVVASTRTYTAIAEDLLRNDRPDLLAVYLESIDTLSHLFVREPRGERAIQRAYEDADQLLKRLAIASPPDALIFVCSDHGFQPPTAGVSENPADLAGPATAWHRPYGIIAAASAGALAGGAPGTPRSSRSDRTELVTPLDIAPTLLHAAGLPVSTDMPGRVIRSLLPEEVAAREPQRAASPRFVPPSPLSTSRVDDREAMSRLRALGYIGAVTTSLARQNLAESLFRRGKLPAAERELRAIVEAQPRNLAARLWLAQTLVRQGRTREAIAEYERAVRLPGGGREALVQATDVAIAAGDLEAAQRLIGLPGAPPAIALVSRGALAEARHDRLAAEREYRAALAIDPASFDAAARLFDVVAAAGRGSAALGAVERAARLVPDSPRHVALLGEVRLSAGDARGAEATLRRALTLAPDSDAVKLALGRTLLVQHKSEAALDVTLTAAQSPDREVQLGAIYAAVRDWLRAIEHLQAAVDAGRGGTDVLNQLGWAHLQLGHREQAATLFARSIAAKPQQPEIRRLLGDLRGARQEGRR